tara:strand:- start:1182 stop:1574 length:393 start_codon:yes stop_codon:yes gene_type:complete
MKKQHRLLNAEILLEKSHKTPRKKVIQKLQQALDKDKITLTTFRATGQLMTMDTYKGMFRQHDLSVVDLGFKLLPNATEVLRYAGGFIIQLLPEKHYALNYHKELEVSLDLKNLEKKIFEDMGQDMLLNF